MACLDTSALLDLARRAGNDDKTRVQARIDELVRSGETLTTTRFSVAELHVGIERSLDQASERRKVESLLAPLPILDFDQQAAELFGRIVGVLQERGSTIGDMDALIASVCLVHGSGVVTRNTRHFSRVPGLVVHGY